MAVFISYRRDDSPGSAGRMFDGLAAVFGADAVFLDVTDIGAGTDFADQLGRSLEQTSVFLAVIGPRWLDAPSPRGGRRLDDERDFVRMELGTALRRQIPIIPILVDGARMPRQEDLPEPLRALARRQALELRHDRWDTDLQLLIAGIRGTARFPARTRRFGARETLVLVLVLVAAAVAGGWVWRSHQPKSPPGNVPIAGGHERTAMSKEALLVVEDPKDTVTFGALDVGQRSSEVRIRIANRGLEPAEIYRAGMVGDHAADFVVVSGCNNATLEHGETCELTAQFRPSTTGPRSASLSVEYFGRNNPLLIPVFGQGR